MYRKLFRRRVGFLVFLLCITGILLLISNKEYILMKSHLLVAPIHTHSNYAELLAKYQGRLNNAIKIIPNFTNFHKQCSNMENGYNFNNYKLDRFWSFNESMFHKRLFDSAKNRCSALRERLAFADVSFSEEEKEFPLAYSFLVYESSIQIYLLLSAIYQPQNTYCIAVDAKSSKQFKADMDLLADCFDNIFVFHVGKVEWCGYTIVSGVMICLRHLSQLSHRWKYVQDLPLKTNLEMVRIFKRLNGTINAEVSKFQPELLKSAANKSFPVPLWKSSLSSLLPRATVDAMINSRIVRDLLFFLQLTYCPDESLWTTIAGNPVDLPIINSFNATAIYEKLLDERSQLEKNQNSSVSLIKNKLTLEEPFALENYYISRHQVWASTKDYKCFGKIVHGSCVFGIRDLKNLLTRPELIAHKFYLNFEPAAYFCLYYAVRSRANDYRVSQNYACTFLKVV